MHLMKKKPGVLWNNILDYSKINLNKTIISTLIRMKCSHMKYIWSNIAKPITELQP